MDWTRDLPGWSHPSLSRRIVHGSHRWHVQDAGSGPSLLLLPGAGASVHTWRDLILPLAETHHVIAIDLPGQGFTQSPNNARSGLEETSSDLRNMITDNSWKVETVIGHSAGAAIGLKLAQTLPITKVIGINPALDNFEGMAGWLFPILARMLAANPFTANIFAGFATPARARRLIEGTGSKIDAEGLSYYTRLTGDRAHVNGALQMMARWSLETLLKDLPQIPAETLFITGSDDKAVPPNVAERAASRLPNALLRQLEGLGHLAHEEDPARVLAEIRNFL